jgi:hypothetical protein
MVRVAGHCACPPPDEWKIWIYDGKEVVPTKEEKSLIKCKSIPQEQWRSQYIFHNNPELIGAKAFISSYHIDDLAGLRLFADVVRPLSDGIKASESR